MVFLTAGGILIFFSLAASIGWDLRSLFQGDQSCVGLKAELKRLEIAIKGYQTEYNRMPLAEAPKSNTTVHLAEGRLLAILLGEDRPENPRGVRFYDPVLARNGRSGLLLRPDGTKALVDKWGQVILVQMDVEGWEEIPDPEDPSRPPPSPRA